MANRSAGNTPTDHQRGSEAHEVRIDKWLWAARFFKTRALASHACELGRIESSSTKAKASRDVRLGDLLTIQTEAATFTVEVLQLSDVRGPAAAAQALYRETAASQAARAKAAEERKEMLDFGAVGQGRPSKRDRHDLQRIRGRG